MNREKLEAEIATLLISLPPVKCFYVTKKILTAIDAYLTEVIGPDDRIDNMKLIHNDFEEQMKADWNMLRHWQRIRANIHPSATNGKEGEV